MKWEKNAGKAMQCLLSRGKGRKAGVFVVIKIVHRRNLNVLHL